VSEFVIAGCYAKISVREVWLPVAMIHLETELVVGNVRFQTLTNELFDRWISEANVEDKDKNQFEEFMRRWQKELQGFPVAIYATMGDVERALEIGIEESEMAISLLRIFCPAAPFASSCFLLHATGQRERSVD